MKINIPPSKCIGAEVLDIDVVSVNEAQVNTIKQLVYNHKLVIFRNQNINEAQYLEFANKICTPQIYPQDNYHHPDYPEIFVRFTIKMVVGLKVMLPSRY